MHKTMYLPAFTFIWLGDAPAQSVLVVFITAAYNNTLQITVEHDVYINHIFQPGDAGRVKCDAVLADHDRGVTEMCKQLLPHDLVYSVRSSAISVNENKPQLHFGTHRSAVCGLCG